MADQKISQLTATTSPNDTDVVPIVDTPNTTTKKITWANIKATLKTYLDTLYVLKAGDTMTGALGFNNISTPSAPASGTVNVYGQNAASGVTRLNMQTSTGATLAFFRDAVLTVRNTSGSTINKGKVVYLNGSNGTTPTVALARANSYSTSGGIGFVLANISNNSYGTVQTQGEFTGVDTTSFSEGDTVYIDATTPGAITNVQPSSPNFSMKLGTVVTSNANGKIQILIQPFIPDHTKLANIGTNTHADIDGHLADTADPHGTVLTQTTLVAGNGGLSTKDLGGSWRHIHKPNETNTNTRTINWKVNDADRTIDLFGNLTVPSAATVSGTNTGDEPSATSTAEGVVELATSAEVTTGTDTVRAMTPESFQQSNKNIRYLDFYLIDSATDLTTGTGKGGNFECPFAGTITAVGAYVNTAGTTNASIIDINKNGTTIMTTNKCSIDSGEVSTRTAATAPTLTTTAITAGDLISFDIDSLSTTAPKGLHVRMEIRLT